MHVNAKKMAYGGLLLALTVVCMVLGSVIESSTLFLLAGASYFVGIVIREAGMRTGVAFYLAAVLLGFMVAPNKVYVISFAAMALYILAIELAFRMIGKMKVEVNRTVLFWAIKYLVFNALYIPGILLFQKILFGRSLPALWLFAIILAGQVGVWIYDRAYEYVQKHIWGKYRVRFL